MAQGSNIFIQWLEFQFVDVPREILKAWRNFLLFNLKFFSVGLLLKTFFSYWRNNKWSSPRSFDIGGFFSAAAGNLISRILGALMRSLLIVVGILAEIFILAVGAVILAAWIVLPAVLILGILFGLNII